MRQSWSDDRLDDLQMEMRAGFARIEKQIEQMDKRIDRRLEGVEKRVDRVDDRVEFGFGRLDGRIDSQARAITYLATVMFTTIAALYASQFFG